MDSQSPRCSPMAGRSRRPSVADLTCLAHQLGRRSGRLHPVERIACVCPHGCPAVVECLPYEVGGSPFPTLFYASCPTLVEAVHAVESRGGVERLGSLLEDDSAGGLTRSLREAERYERRRRRTLLRRHPPVLPAADGGAVLSAGIGGVRGRRGLKCLHCHAAHALARPCYDFGRLILTDAEALSGSLWCADARCLPWMSA